jgi:hypothetical protein
MYRDVHADALNRALILVACPLNIAVGSLIGLFAVRSVDSCALKLRGWWAQTQGLWSTLVPYGQFYEVPDTRIKNWGLNWAVKIITFVYILSVN